MEWGAGDPEQLVSSAVAFAAQSAEARAMQREKLQTDVRAHAAERGPAMARALAQAFRAIWRKACGAA